jgi:hypothetical protein
MKRFLLGLIVLGGLSLMAAPQARAQALCGHSYAALMTGATPNFTADGPNTAAVGVGTLTFGTLTPGEGCTVTGELIYNAGDVQSGAPNANGQQSPIGDFFGPSNCFSDFSNEGGVPCFDGNLGGTDLTGTLSPGGYGGSYILSFSANYNWFDTTDGPDIYGAFPFGFFVQIGKSETIAVGNTIASPSNNAAGPYEPGNGDPILNLTLNEQATAGMPSTTFGDAPFLGSDILSCTAYGANSTDGVAALQSTATATAGTTVTGALETTLGSYVVFSTGQAGGELTFNNNNGYVVPSSGPVPDNNLCPFALIPQNAGPFAPYYDNSSGATAAIFADGAANFVASLEGTFATNPYCEDLTTAGAGYADSSVQYGTTDQNSYIIVTGLYGTASYFVPVGGQSYCVSYPQGNAYALKTAAKSPAKATVLAPSTTAPVQVENENETLCDTEVTMASNTATTSYTHGAGANVESWNTTCTVALVGGSPSDAAAVGPSTAAQTVAETSCTCTCSGFVGTGSYASGSCAVTQGPTTTSSTLSIASQACPMPVTTFPITCAN